MFKQEGVKPQFSRFLDQKIFVDQKSFWLIKLGWIWHNNHFTQRTHINSTSTRKNDPRGLKFCRRPYQAKLTTIQHNFNPTIFWGGGSYILHLGLTLCVFSLDKTNFGFKSIRPKRQYFFYPKIFLAQQFFDRKFFFTKKIFNQKNFLPKNFFTPKFFLHQIFFYPKIFLPNIFFT